MMADRISVLADFVSMRWDNQDGLPADARVSKEKNVAVTLTERHDGKREWLLHVER